MTNEDFKKMLKLRAFNLARAVIRLVDGFPQKRAAWVIADQLIAGAELHSASNSRIESRLCVNRKEQGATLLLQ